MVKFVWPVHVLDKRQEKIQGDLSCKGSARKPTRIAPAAGNDAAYSKADEICFSASVRAKKMLVLSSRQKAEAVEILLRVSGRCESGSCRHAMAELSHLRC